MKLPDHLLAQRPADMNDPNFLTGQGGSAVDDIVGQVTDPFAGKYPDLAGGGLIQLLANILRLLFVAAGIFAFFNIIVAGYQFMNAAGDSKKIVEAWGRIWQSLIGLILIVGSFALASIFGHVVFGRADFILSPRIFGPGQ